MVLGAMRRVIRTAIMVVRWANAGPRSQGLRGFVRLNFRVAVPGVSGVSNPGY